MPRRSPRCWRIRLGIPFERIKLLQGDSDQLIAGGGTGGSRSMMQSGGAIVAASDLVIETGSKLAAHFLEAAAGDIEFSARGASLSPAPTSASASWNWPRGCAPAAPAGRLPRTLMRHVFKGVPSAFPNGCHVAEIELDPDTGIIEVVRYATVNDFGVLVNPMLVEGQAHGGIAQGIGQALMEIVAYDEDGQLLTGSFMDYGAAARLRFCRAGFESHPVPARTNPLGAKGCGEAGCAGSLPAVMNALVDALRNSASRISTCPRRRIGSGRRSRRRAATTEANRSGADMGRPLRYTQWNTTKHPAPGDAREHMPIPGSGDALRCP